MIEESVGADAELLESSGGREVMRAVMLAGFGGLNKLKVIKKEMPEPRDGEVKIRVKAW